MSDHVINIFSLLLCLFTHHHSQQPRRGLLKFTWYSEYQMPIIVSSSITGEHCMASVTQQLFTRLISSHRFSKETKSRFTEVIFILYFFFFSFKKTSTKYRNVVQSQTHARTRTDTKKHRSSDTSLFKYLIPFVICVENFFARTSYFWVWTVKRSDEERCMYVYRSYGWEN